MLLLFEISMMRSPGDSSEERKKKNENCFSLLFFTPSRKNNKRKLCVGQKTSPQKQQQQFGVVQFEVEGGGELELNSKAGKIWKIVISYHRLILISGAN